MDSERVAGDSEVILPSFADQALPTRLVSDSTQAFIRWVVDEIIEAFAAFERAERDQNT